VKYPDKKPLRYGIGAAGFLKQRGFRNSILDLSIISKLAVPLLVLLEIDVNDSRSVFELAGYQVSVYSVGIHRSGVTDDRLEHRFRHLVFEQADKSMAERIRASREIPLFCDTDPVVSERALGKRASDLAAEDPGRVQLRVPEDVLVYDLSGDLVEIYPALGVLVFAFRDSVPAVDRAVDRQDVVLYIILLDSEDLSGPKSGYKTKAEYIDVPVRRTASGKEPLNIRRLKDNALTLVCGGGYVQLTAQRIHVSVRYGEMNELHD